MFPNLRQVEYTIKQSDYEKIDKLFSDLKEDNKLLTNELGKVNATLNGYVVKSGSLEDDVKRLKIENAKLTKALTEERHVTTLVVNKLKELTNYEHRGHKIYLTADSFISTSEFERKV